MIDATELSNSLSQFSGTEGYHRWSGLFQNMVLTDGTKYLAEKAGAYWLFDAIATSQPSLRNNERLQEFQLWTLKKNKTGRGALLSCFQDSGMKASKTQKIAYTDFPLDEIKFYVEPSEGNVMVIMLPSER